MSPGADTAYLGTQQEAPHEQKQEVPSETPVRAPAKCFRQFMRLQLQADCPPIPSKLPLFKIFLEPIFLESPLKTSPFLEGQEAV